ncbi:MAG TPA: dihydrofolate reductase family protein [Burkholderiaceae bacterium]
MGKVRVAAFSVSIDGFGAGRDQSLENPLGIGGKTLHQWFFNTHRFQQMIGGQGGVTDANNAFAERGFENIGAWILGRNMFGPVRGPWPDESWQGWWGDEPPYHVPTFVLTHHARPALVMKGGTVFHFVTGGIEEALARAQEAAQGKDIRIGGGVDTVRQYLQAGLVDEMHLAISPTVLGRGESLLAGIDLQALGFSCTEHVSADKALHVVLSRKG